MSATPNNAGPELGNSQLLPYAPDTQTPARAGQDALQVLLAFACIHEQTAKRRSAGLTPETYADARLSVSFAQRAVRYDEREVALTRLEYRLLSAFVGHPNQVLSHYQLRELVWGDSLATSRDEVKLYVGYLRRKLDPDEPGSTPIETVRGFGYRYRPPG